MIYKETIRGNFSKHAEHYDNYCSVQNHSAKRLISKIKKDGLKKILDIGCGTGNYTRLLREKFPEADIKAIDISSDMIQIAKSKLTGSKMEFIVADAETKKFDGKFDMITSNASFQWFLNLEKTLTKYKELLERDSVIIFSVFGPETFCELNVSLKELLKKDTSLTSCGFVKKEMLKEILEKQFGDVFVEEEIFQEEYNSLLQLLNKIRYTGTKGSGISVGNFWTHKRINELEEIYNEKFGNLVATYQIFYCQGIA
ncbi:MAG: malonyl-ACP O-methyltransferase BioC [Elusimicrobia bacterium]|nr:malonyl-ACP O-methyltransferase BioC [Elusimicrobiota bacterium]